MAFIRLDLQGEPGTIAAHAFHQAEGSLQSLLTDLDHVLSEQKQTTLHWFITQLKSNGCLRAEYSPVSKFVDVDVSSKVTKAAVEALRIIEAEPTTPPNLSETGIKKAQSLIKIIGKDGVSGLKIEDETSVAELSEQAVTNAQQMLIARSSAIGSVEGRLDAISLRGRTPKFWVLDSLTRKTVSCKFEGSWLERIKDALGRRVSVSGIVSYNGKGDPLRVEIQEIDILRNDIDVLALIEQLGGSDPDFTGDMTTAEYIRSIRGG